MPRRPLRWFSLFWDALRRPTWHGWDLSFAVVIGLVAALLAIVETVARLLN